MWLCLSLGLIMFLSGLATPVQALVHEIGYTSEGFQPASILAKVRDTVKISNLTETDLRLFNTEYAADQPNFKFNVGLIKPGTYFSLVVTNPGTFVFHNRLNREHVGKVTVLEKQDLIAYYRERGDEAKANTIEQDVGSGEPVEIENMELISEPATSSEAASAVTEDAGWLIIVIIVVLTFVVLLTVLLVKG